MRGRARSRGRGRGARFFSLAGHARAPPPAFVFFQPLPSPPPTLSCAYVLATPACGPRSGRLPYTRAWFCRDGRRPLLAAAAVLGAAAWGGALAWLLAVVSSSFLVPAVAYAAEALRVPPALAGVTLLAFAGGAPDLFTEVAAVLASSGDGGGGGGGGGGRGGARGPPTTADDVGLAVATALGSGLATLCGGLAVVGLAGRSSASAAVPAFPDRAAFFRDVGTYAASSAALAACLWNGRFAAGEAGGLLALYVFYIAASVWGARGGGGGGGGGSAPAEAVVVHPPAPSSPGGIQLSAFARGEAGSGQAPPPGTPPDGGPVALVVASPRAPGPLGGGPLAPAPGLRRVTREGGPAPAGPPAPPSPALHQQQPQPPTPASPVRAGLVPPPPSRLPSGGGGGGGNPFGSGGWGRAGGVHGPGLPLTAAAASPSELGPLLAAADWDDPPAAAKHRGRSSAGGWEGWGAGASPPSPPLLLLHPSRWPAAVVAAAASAWPAPPHWHPVARAVGGGLVAPVLLALHATTPCLAGATPPEHAHSPISHLHVEHAASASSPPAGPSYTLLYAAILSVAAPPAALAFLGAAPGGRHAAWWGPPAFCGAWAAGAALLGLALAPPLLAASATTSPLPTTLRARLASAVAPRANPAMAGLALLASSAWLSASADEAVELVRWLGRAAGWRAESVGGALLSWGEALPELAAAASLAAAGAPAMALSSAFGGPIFDVCVGLAVPALAAAGRDRQALGAPLTRGLATLTAATLAVLAGLAVAVPAGGYRVGRGLGLAVAGAYVVAVAAFAAVEGLS